MPRIRLLPESLANQIAAGEVIERPASVVKELVENALDAGARRIEIEVAGGGQQLIRVSDNGGGMDRQDILLCLERHATSKIAGDKDLLDIRTLGFRGEALPSIASVSKMTITSRLSEDLSGHRVTIHFGKIKEVTDVGCPQGTVVEVASLFGNVPARRKFLKSHSTETAHIQDCVVHMALADGDVHLVFKNEGRVVLSYSRGETLEDRLKSLLRPEERKSLVQLEDAGGDVHLFGHIAKPDVTRASLQSLYIFANGRFVRDRIIQHAVLEAYQSFLMKGRYPVGAIYVTLPPPDIDINVHPTKHEVRFRDPKAIHSLVTECVRRALLSSQTMARHGLPQGLQVSSKTAMRAAAQPIETQQSEPVQTSMSLSETPASYAPSRPALRAPEAAETAPPELRLIGQLAGSYLLCQSSQGLIIIDQHAAHERILFERLRQAFQGGYIETQQLLFPITLELTRSEANLLSQRLQDLAALGLELSPFGGETFALRAVPAVLAGRHMKELVESILARMGPAGGSFLDERLLHDVLALMACKGAIKAGQALTGEEMESLLRQLKESPVSSNCPHGRPIWRLYTYYEIEKAFKRT